MTAVSGADGAPTSGRVPNFPPGPYPSTDYVFGYGSLVTPEGERIAGAGVTANALRGYRRPVTAARLAEQLGVSERTIYRDIQTLSGLGAPLRWATGLP